MFKDKSMMQIFQSTTTFPVNPDVEGLSVSSRDFSFFFFFFPVDKEVSKFSACQTGCQ